MKLTVIKKISKQGDNLLLIIPKNLHQFLGAGDLVKVDINKLNTNKIEINKLGWISRPGNRPEVQK